ALTPDNRRWLSVPVRDRLNVLLVNGRESGDTLGRASDYVALALMPSGDSEAPLPGAGAAPIYRPVVVSEAELARTELSRFDCIVMCDVPFLDEIEQQRLQAFVRGGGGLVVGAGDQLRLDAWNQWFQREPQP